MTERDNPLNRRHSVADEAVVAGDAQSIARAEARNALRQFDYGMRAAEDAIARGVGYQIRPSLILGMHREAMAGLTIYAGNYRPGSVSIQGSRLRTPDAHLVPELIEDMCDYLNDNWSSKSAFHLAAYAMWRLNAIHPFTDGNGRTSRIFSYFVLCAKLGYIVPGENTIPDQIEADRQPYFDALEVADAAFDEGRIDVGAMEALLDRLLAQQFLDMLKKASGSGHS